MAVRAPQSERVSFRETAIVCCVAVALTFCFWSELWKGYGLIGGDVYSYFMPQKKFFVDCLRQGEFPLWNNLVGHGYPILAESQTGALYPFNLLLYWLCDVNTAYNAVQIVHYVLTFVFTWMFARRLNLGPWGAGFAALVYTYGWFPSRICLEWAILGGAWLPLALWCVEDYLQTGRKRGPLLLCLALAMQILPGHYHLAFITLVTLAAYVPLRLWFAAAGLSSSVASSRFRSLTVLGLAILCAFGLTAMQLVPTWELKRQSQRAEFAGEKYLSYGQIPPRYLLQVFAPWWYFDETFDLNSWVTPGSSLTNKVEAHLYFGQLTWGLLAWGLCRGLFLKDRRLWVWAALGLLALVYTTGWFLPVTRHIPGFNFFRGEGRYGIITTLAVALLAGTSLDDLCARFSPNFPGIWAAIILAATTGDLWMVGPAVTPGVSYTAMVAHPPLNSLPESPIRRILSTSPGPVRLFSQGANLPTLLGVACTPPYLGIGPGAYYDPATMLPEPIPYDRPATQEQIDWLRRAGVTHVLSFIPLDGTLKMGKNKADGELIQWPVKELWRHPDVFLGRAWARVDPIYLYELTGSRGRIAWSEPRPGDRAKIRRYRANRVEAEVESASGGRLILTDLNYPGWQVTIDNQPAAGITVEGMYRGVVVPAGPHTIVWSYSPRSLKIGGLISCLTLLLALPGLLWLGRATAG